MRTLESAVHGNMQAAFGGGPGEKGCNRNTSPAAYPTSSWVSMAQDQKQKRSSKNSAHSSERNSSCTSQRKRRSSHTREARLQDFWDTKSRRYTKTENGR